MSEELSESIAESIQKSTIAGSDFSIGDLRINRGSIDAQVKARAHMQREEQRKSGKRPLFRSFNMSGAAYS